tara:strand:+ start:481 stop:1305 length:825 start_codon:yes stop_codon:yes gene_type:complete
MASLFDIYADMGRQRANYAAGVGGLLMEKPLENAALATMFTPVVGDITGLLADAKMYATEPEQRNLLNYGLTAAGVLPFVPAVSSVKKTVKKLANPKTEKELRGKIKYNQKEKRILEGDGRSGGFLKDLFSTDTNSVIYGFETYGIDADLLGPAKLPKGGTLRFKNKIYNQTQESLKDQPETMLVYRHGRFNLPSQAGEPVSFTLAPFRGQLPSQGYAKNAKGVSLKEDDFEVYAVDKKDILANFEAVLPRYHLAGSSNERELLIFPDKVKKIK